MTKTGDLVSLSNQNLFMLNWFLKNHLGLEVRYLFMKTYKHMGLIMSKVGGVTPFQGQHIVFNYLKLFKYWWQFLDTDNWQAKYVLCCICFHEQASWGCESWGNP